MQPPTGDRTKGREGDMSKSHHAQTQITQKVLLGCVESRELEDGYELSYPDTPSWNKDLDLFCVAWRASSPGMSLEVKKDVADGFLWLQIRGPEGTKQFVEGARYILRSHINPPLSLSLKMRRGVNLLTSPLRVLPNFLVIGAKKAGTTALYDYVTQHPRVLPGLKKEISFFNGYYGRGQFWYRSFFPTVFSHLSMRLKEGGPFLTGEATPDYLWRGDCAGRVKALVPKVKLVAILRNPVDRAFSQYNHNRRGGLEDLSFEAAVDGEAERISTEELQGPRPDQRPHFMHHSYKQRGIYVDRLSKWLEVIPREQLLVVKTEDMYQEPEAILRRVFEFLDLPYHEPREFRKLNNAVYEAMDSDVRSKLEAYFAPHNARLAELLGVDRMW